MPFTPDLCLELPPPESRRLKAALHSQLREAIREGRLGPGDQLPASRVLAARIGRSRKSVVAVYDRLIAEGLAEARAGAGVFVVPASRPHEANVDKSPPAWLRIRQDHGSPSEDSAPGNVRFDLRPGAPETAQFPFEVWGRLVGRSLRSFSRGPRYREPAGHPALREAIAGHLAFSRGISCSAAQVIVTTGAQQAHDLIARCFVGRGRTVAVEDPGYPAIAAGYSAAGANIARVPVDESGLDIGKVPDGSHAVCITPTHHFPTGVPLSNKRRGQLLELARRTDAIVIEDDFGGEFRFSSAAAESLFQLDREARVFFIGTFSLSMLPALRIGYVVAPDWALPALAAGREALDWHGAAIEQGALAMFISEGHLARHIRRMRRIYAERRLELLRALEKHCPDLLRPMRGAGGLHLAAIAPDRWDMMAWQREAAERGVSVDCLDQYTACASAPPGFAIGLGLVPAESLDAAVALLAASVPGKS